MWGIIKNTNICNSKRREERQNNKRNFWKNNGYECFKFDEKY